MKTKSIILIFALLLMAEMAVGQACTTTLSSGSVNQTVCINSGITSIVWTTDATSITSTPNHGLPTGVTATLLPGVSLTISGTPSVAGSFPYTVELSSTGACSVSGTINVTASVGTPVFSLGATSSRCKGAGTVTYTATASDNTGISYALDATTLAFAGNSINSGTGAVTYAAGWSGTSTITATATGCSGPSTADHVATTHALPTVYSVTGDGSYCSGGTGLSVILSNSEADVSYELFKDAVATGTTKAGTGSSISFDNVTAAGTYTIKGTRGSSCVSTMSGNAVITIDPLPNLYTVGGGGSYCSGGSGVNITLSDSQNNFIYELFRDAVATGITKTGNNSSITFNGVTVAGTYTIKGTNNTTLCTTFMTGSTSVTVNPLPNATFTVGGGGLSCSGGTGVSVTLSGSEAGVTYELFKNSTGTGTTLAGTGSPLSFNGVTAAGTYTIKGTTASSCIATMSGSAVITTATSPTSYTVAGGGSYCSGGTGVSITLSNTQSGVNYELFKDAVATGIIIAGTNSPITFTNVTAAGTYTIKGTNVAPCTTTMSGSATVTINALPVAGAITGGTTVCMGSTLALTSNATGTATLTYTWNSSDGTKASVSNAGLVTPIAVGNTDITYTVTDGNTCQATSPVNNVTISPLPAAITGEVDVCIGSTTDLDDATPGGSWSSSNTAVATINSSGVVSGLSAGTSLISYTVLGCSVSTTVTVNPAGQVNDPADQILCNGATTNLVDFTTILGGGVTTFYWTNDQPSINLAASGTDDIPAFTATNSGNALVVATITVTPHYKHGNVTCIGTPQTFTITVYPTPIINSAASKTICNSSSVNYNITTPTTGPVTYTWTTSITTTPAGGTITGFSNCSSGCGTNIGQTLVNTGTSPGVVRYRITPTGPATTSCIGAPFDLYVTVNPSAQVNDPADFARCHNTSTSVTFSTLNSGGTTTYDWTNSNTGIGLGAAGSGDISSFIATNSGTVPITATITVTPSFEGCSGTPQTFIITVNPLPTLSSVSQAAQICSGAKATINLTGLIGTSSAVTYQIGTNTPVTKTGIPVTGGNANFQTDDLEAVNNGKSLTITSITNENTGCSAAFSQSTLLIVNTATTPTLSGDLTPCINSTEVYTTQSGMNTNSYVWSFSGGGTYTGGGINDNTITVTWTSTGTKTIGVNFTNSNGCTAASATTISPVVSPLPTPSINGPASACLNSSGNVYSTLAGMSGYDWEITGGSITSGGDNNNFAVVTWTSDGSRSITVNYTNASGCAATLPTIYPVTVNPLPVVATPGTASTCSGTSPNIALTASETSNFTWTVGAISGSISGATSGSGNTINQVLGNSSNSSAGTVEYLVTPTSTTGSCAGSAKSIVVTVYPSPVVTNSATTTICSGTGPNISLTSSVPGNFTWTVGTNTGGIAGATAGSGSTINQTLTNPSNSSAGSVQYLVTPTSTTGTCTGNTYSIVVTVNPTPVVTTATATSICSGTAPGILLTASTQSTFTWTVGAISGSISGASAGSGSTINQVLSNPSNTITGTVEYLVTPVSITGSCTGSPLSIVVTVNPLPLPSLAGPLTVRVTSTGNLYTTETGMSNYIWAVSSGGSVAAGGTTGSSSVNVTWNTTGPQSVSVKYTNTNNCTALAATPASVTVNPLPSVSSVSISGTPAIGFTLTGSFAYTDGGGGASISTFRWLRNGTPVSGEVLNTYLLTAADLNKTITFEVTPKTSVGIPDTGTPVVSSPTLPVENLSEIPVADQVCIEGVRTAGNTLKGKYRYTHSKPEGASTYKWYNNGVAIPSATGTQYTLLASDIDNDEDITFEVTPVSSNVVPVTGIPAGSNPMAKIPLLPTEYSVAVSAVPLTASPAGGIFSGPGVTNGIFSPSSVGVAGSPYALQYLLNIVNSSTSCSQTVWKNVSVVSNTTEFTSFKPVYCQTDVPDEIIVSGLLTGATSIGFTLSDPDAIVSSTDWTVTIDPRKMRPGNNIDYLYFRYKDFRGYEYQISKSFVVDSVGTGLQIINLNNEYCAETPKVNISVTGTYPSGGTGAWTSSLLSDLAATSASVNVALVTAGPTYPLSYQYTSPLGCRSIVINRSVTVNPLPNPAFTIAPFYNIDGGAATLVPVQSPGTFSGNGVSGDKLYPDIAGLGEHTINYYIKDNKGCVDDLDIKTTVKKAQGTFTDIPAIICYRDTTYNVKVTGLPSGMSVNSFVNSRNSINHIAGATDANYSVKAAGHGLDTLTFSYKLDGVDYWVSRVVNIDSLGLVQIQNLFPGDKVCDNRAPYELFTSMPGGVFSGPVAGNYLDPTKATGLTSVSYKFTNSRTACSTSTVVPFSIIPAPQASFMPKDVCIESSKDSTYFMNTTVSSDPVYEWTWTFAEVGAAPSNRKEPAFLYKNGGIHTVSLNVRTVSGCFVTKTSNIDLGIRPIADFTWKNDCFAPGAKLNLSDATFTNFPVISRTWNFNNGSMISSDLIPEYTMQDTGYVHVKYIVRTNYTNCADTVSRRIYLRPTISIPIDGFYYQDFETGKAGWGKDDSDPSLIWSFGTPDRTRINKAKSGVTAWYTKYESDKQGISENSSIISPCFDFTNIERPMITLQAFKIFEKNRNGAALQYKTEGSDWKYVGTLDDGINWYNSTLINGKPGGDKIGWTTLSDENADVDYVPSSHALDELKGKKNVKFRLAYGSDGNSLDREGIAFDNIWIGERTRKVLFEHFTNTFSKKGSEATAFVNKIIKVRDKDVINIQYHTNFPDDDPFYLVNPGDASARIFSYGLSKVPYSLIDGGFNSTIYASLSDYKTAPIDSNNLSRRSLKDSPFSISITPKIAGGVLTVSSTVAAVNAFSSDNLILYLVVTEKEVVSDKPAAMGEVIFKNVFRKFIPDAGGIELKKAWTKGETFSIPEKTWVIENIKNFADIEVIVFIQNSQTKEVYQANSATLKTGKSVLENSQQPANAAGNENNLMQAIVSFSIYPNPASDKLQIEFSDKLASETDVRIFDFQGAVKKTYKVASGESGLFIDDIGLKAGIYLVRISSGGVDLGFRKLIITGE